MSTPFSPAFNPQSSMRTPGMVAPLSSRIGTSSAATPQSCPPVLNCANTAAIRPSRAALPMYSLRASSSGVFTTNSPDSGSYVAVVRTCATSEPCPVSVIAKQPSSLPLTMSAR